MINPFVIKKYGALLTCAFFGVIGYNVGNLYGGWIWGVGSFFVSALVAVFVGVVLLNNPFSKLLEGRGILAFDISSSGVIRPFIVAVNQPFIRAKLPNGDTIEDVFNREAVSQLAEPVKSGNLIQSKTEVNGKKYIMLTFDEDEYNKARFALFQYPVLIYNSQLKTFVTKDALSTLEKDILSEHLILYLTRKIEELTSVLRDFARHVIEQLKPQGNWLNNKWTWIILIIALGIIGFMFAPHIINAFQSGLSSGSGAVSEALGSGAAVVPAG